MVSLSDGIITGKWRVGRQDSTLGSCGGAGDLAEEFAAGGGGMEVGGGWGGRRREGDAWLRASRGSPAAAVSDGAAHHSAPPSTFLDRRSLSPARRWGGGIDSDHEGSWGLGRERQIGPSGTRCYRSQEV